MEQNNLVPHYQMEVSKPAAGKDPKVKDEAAPVEGAQVVSDQSKEGMTVADTTSNNPTDAIELRGEADFNATRADMDAQALQTGLEQPVTTEMPEEEYAGKIGAWMAKGFLRHVKTDGTPKKEFKIGDQAEIKSDEEFEVPEPDMDASDLVNRTAADFNTDDLWQTNFGQLENEDDVNGLIAAVSENMSDQIMEARGGIRKDAEIQGLADDIGADPKFLREFMGAKDSEFVEPEKILAARQILNQSATYLHDLAKLVANGDANPKQQLAFKKQYAFHQQFMGQFMAKRANVGRALRAYGIPTGSGDAQFDHVQEMLQSVHGGLDLEAAAKQISQAPTAKGVHDMVNAQEDLMRMGGNMFMELFVNSVLSGIKTHIINTTGSAMMLGMRTLDTAVAARLGVKSGDVAMKVDADEWKAGVFGLMNGTFDAWRVAREVLNTGEAYGGVSKVENTGRQFISSEYMGMSADNPLAMWVDLAGGIIRAPTERLMGSVDGFMKVLTERQTLAQVGFRIANAESIANKWDEETTLMRLKALMANPTDDMINEAQEAALHVTFQSPLGAQGKDLQAFVGGSPMTQFVAPFVKTPINLMKQGFLERTPIGYLATAQRAELNAEGARGQMARARMYVGTSFALAGSAFVLGGYITGAGSTNYKVRKAQEATGWQPYSFVIADDNGTKTYYSFKRTEPISYVLATMADLHDAIKMQPVTGEDDSRWAERVTGAFITAISHATLDRSFLTSLKGIMDLMSNPTGTRVQSWIKRQVNATVPYAGLRRDYTRAFDDSKKATDGILDEIRANIPYYNADLPNQLDVFGDPMEWDAVLNPLPSKTEKKNKILDEAARIALSTNKSPLALPSKMINGVRLSSQQYHDLIHISRNMDHSGVKYKDAILSAINSREYDLASDENKYVLLRKITGIYDNIGRKLLFENDKDLFMKVEEKNMKQNAESLRKKSGTDAGNEFLKLKQKTSDAYDSAYNK